MYDMECDERWVERHASSFYVDQVVQKLQPFESELWTGGGAIDFVLETP